MSDNVKLSIALVLVGALGLLVYLSLGNDTPEGSANPEVTRADSHYLTKAPDDKVTIVEFLDFECEACRAAFPLVERLRADYGDRVNFVIRYFPIPSHFNAERAARAVESAGQQGKFEPMYKKMYETLAEWGEQQTPADSTFRGFATELGLDIAAFDAAYYDPATLDRVKVDVADGKALGVKGTPTFFLNGDKLKFTNYEDLSAAVEEALKK